MVPGRPVTRRDALRVGLGAAVFAVAFAVAATVTGRLHLPYLEPMVGLLALALLVGAALTGAPRRVRVRFRRSVLAGFGLLLGWWSIAVWRPSTPPLVLVVPLTWAALATAESARSPSLPWSLGVASAPAVGGSVWMLRSMAHRYGSWWRLASRARTDTGIAGSFLEETVGVLLLLGVTPGIAAYLVGRTWHGTDGWRPQLRRPDDRTVALLAAAGLSALSGLRLLP